MPASKSQRVVARSTDQGLVIEVIGEFNYEVHPGFRQAYESQERRFSRYTVNLKRCTGLDSTGLGMLLLLRDYTQLQKEALLITHCTHDVRMMLRYASFDQLFMIHTAGPG